MWNKQAEKTKVEGVDSKLFLGAWKPIRGRSATLLPTLLTLSIANFDTSLMSVGGEVG